LVDTIRKERMSIMPKKRKYTPEYRAEAVRLVEIGDRAVAEVARDLGISMQTLWQWVQQAKVDSGQAGEALTTTERDELRQLRREVARLREEREILKKATAFFAKESK
jgi:transposase